MSKLVPQPQRGRSDMSLYQVSVEAGSTKKEEENVLPIRRAGVGPLEQ
jgi:hypothetical protein